MSTHREDVERYVAGVLDGSIVAGSLVQAAVRRYVDDIEHAEDRGFCFDEASAVRAITFIECLKHSTGDYAGEHFLLRLFQKFIVWNLFGWKLKRTGFRRFRKAFISLGRGNGKSPLGAAIANYMFCADSPTEMRAQCYACATKEKQARITWEEAAQQIEKSGSPALKGMVRIQRANMHIPATGSKFEPLASDSDTNDGWNIHVAIKDEVHKWSEHHRGLNGAIDTAMAKRRQPMLLTITTAGDDESLLWQEEYDWCSQVVHGAQTADDQFVFIAEVDRERECTACGGKGCDDCGQTGRVEVDVLDEREWPAANPMLNEPKSPVQVDELRSFANKARVLPSKLREFRRFHANQMVCSYTRLITPELWMRGNRPLRDVAGRDCYLGYDGGARNDLASLAAIFPFEDGTFDALVWAWICRECPHDLEADPWASLIREGHLIVTDGNTTDIDAIYAHMESVVFAYQVKSLAFDPSNAREFGTRCANQWGINTYAFPQNCAKYNEPVEGLIGLLRDGRIHHGGNKLLAWAATNAIARTDSMDRKMPCKAKSKGKIDPLVALLMAHSEAKFAEGVTEVSKFEFELITA